jgi:hypothetical protein
MRYKLKGEQLLTIFLAMISVFYIVSSCFLNARAQFSPLLIGGMILVLLIINFMKTIRKSALETEAETQQKNDKAPNDLDNGLNDGFKRIIGLLITVILFVPLSVFLGFLPAVFLILALYYIFYLKVTVIKSVAVAALVWIFIYVVFVRLLMIPLPAGVLLSFWQ